MPRSTIHRKVLSSSCSARISKQRPLCPTPRANPFPKLRIYFADFPFLLDFYGPEAANLGDLMQLWVRPGVWVHLSFSFSRTGRSAPDTSDDKVICPPLHPISKQSDFREIVVKKKRQRFPKLPSASLNSFTLPHNTHVLVVES